ncbi:GIY-YIG nuclease family protein [Dechloromonas denitrificans]|uniref:GIY-YIG nuclease family protein n=1 Tax=Dechloromonas denitrificans TaxID=281362 RepID=UPI001CF8B505|nr:GIY-YIG nuclease family protein [Dechloromonas denitrificans]UCV10418.1 GIY-YIG nuclease family protein [Dechloromonas denitrificans]
MSSTARILAPTGNFASLAVVERDDWNGARCVLFNREAWSDARQRPELSNPGVYVLIGSGAAYVGEGDPVADRLSSHNLNKHFWSRAFALTSQGGQLNKAHVQYLEAKLCAVLAESYELENKVVPALPCLSEFDYVWVTQALANVLDMLKCFGFILNLRPIIELPANVATESPVVSPQPLGVQVLQKILGMPCSGSATVQDILILCEAGQPEFGKQLGILGLKYTPRIGLHIPSGINAPLQIENLFKGTLLSGGAWQKLLLKTEGVKFTNPRIAGRQGRAICIPCSLCSRGR